MTAALRLLLAFASLTTTPAPLCVYDEEDDRLLGTIPAGDILDGITADDMYVGVCR